MDLFTLIHKIIENPYHGLKWEEPDKLITTQSLVFAFQ